MVWHCWLCWVPHQACTNRFTWPLTLAIRATRLVMVLLSAQCITTSSSRIHCRWITKTNCSLTFGTPGASFLDNAKWGWFEWDMVNKREGVKSSKKSSWIREIAMNMHCLAYNLTCKWVQMSIKLITSNVH